MGAEQKSPLRFRSGLAGVQGCLKPIGSLLSRAGQWFPNPQALVAIGQSKHRTHPLHLQGPFPLALNAQVCVIISSAFVGLIRGEEGGQRLEGDRRCLQPAELGWCVHSMGSGPGESAPAWETHGR